MSLSCHFIKFVKRRVLTASILNGMAVALCWEFKNDDLTFDPALDICSDCFFFNLIDFFFNRIGFFEIDT